MAVGFWIDIENAAGAVQGDGPIVDAFHWRSEATLDRAGSFEFEIPATSERAALVQVARVARCYTIVNGVRTEIGSGTIAEIRVRVADEQPRLTVRGPDLLEELSRVGVGSNFRWAYDREYSADDEIPYKLIHDHANEKLSSAWTIEDEDGTTIQIGDPVTADGVTVRFQDETVLSALIRVAEVTGEHFKLGSGRTLVWIGPSSDFDASGVRAVYGADGLAVEGYSHIAHIADVERVEDGQQIVNRVLLRGGGHGDARMNIYAADTWPDGTAISGSYTTHTMGGISYLIGQNITGTLLDSMFSCLQDSDSKTSYGVREVWLSFPEIMPLDNTDAALTTAANQLLRAGYEWMVRRREPKDFYSLNLAGSPAVLSPGTTIPVLAQVYRDGAQPVDIDATLNIIGAAVRVDGTGLVTTGLTVADTDRQPDSDAGRIVQAMSDAKRALALPQAMPQSYEIAYVENFDDSFVASCDFDLGAAILEVRSVVCKFKFDAFRSTVESITNNAVASDGPSTNTSGAGGNHAHVYNLGTDITQGGITTYHGNNIHTNGGGNITTGNSGTHTHDLGSHTHSVTSNVSIGAGILEQGPTETPAGATWTINVGSPTNAISGPDASGWYTLDLTDDLRDSTTHRPSQTANRLTVGASSGKYGLLRARMQIEVVIQVAD